MSNLLTSTRPTTHGQVAGRILGYLREKGFRPGDRLPSERAFSKELDIPYQAVRQAILLLARNHGLERIVGSGTYLKASLDELAEAGNIRDADGLRVGLLFFGSCDAYVIKLLEEFHRATEIAGIDVLIRPTGHTLRDLLKSACELKESGCHALVLPQRIGLPDSELSSFFAQCPLPVTLGFSVVGHEDLFFERRSEYGCVDRLLCRIAAEYLIGLGVERLAYFGPVVGKNESAQRRIEAFTETCARHDTMARFVLSEAEDKLIDERIKAWKGSRMPDAVCCFDDEYAMHLLAACRAADVEVPKDLRVLGINNVTLAGQTTPPLSSISFDYPYIIHGMLRHLLGRAGKPVDAFDAGHEIKVVLRESCGGVTLSAGQLQTLQAKLSKSCGVPIQFVRK